MKISAILVRYSEIGTKSRQTRRRWEDLLIKNIQADIGEESEVFCSRGRVVVLTERERDLSSVFGIVSYSPAMRVEQELGKIKEHAARIYTGERFRISARRISKEFPYTSRQVNEIVGEHLVKQGGSVDLERFEEEIGIEFLDGYAYIYKETIRGPGGLPVGVQGRVLCFIEDEDDLAAAYLMLKRGCEIDYRGRIPEELYRYSQGHEIHPYDEDRTYPFAVSGKTLDNVEELFKTREKIGGEYGMKTLFPMVAYYDRADNIIKQ